MRKEAGHWGLGEGGLEARNDGGCYHHQLRNYKDYNYQDVAYLHHG